MRRLVPVLLIATALACSHFDADRGRERGEDERYDQPEEAAQFYAAKRSGAADPQRAYDAARTRMASMQRYSTADDRIVGAPLHRFAANDSASAAANATTQPWRFLGPGNIGGRTRSLLIDPHDNRVLYAGAISGGVWKTVTAGERWFPVADRLANLDVSALAFDPSNSSTIYAGTGEGYFREEVRGTNLPLRGDGIFVTRDAGATWEQLASTASNDDFRWVNDLVVSSHDPRRIYAATRTGVHRSDDGGTTWTRVLPVTVKGGCLELAYRGDTANDFLFASCGVFDQATVYRNTKAEAGGGWQSVLSQPGMSRTSLAIAPSNPSIVYALAANADHHMQAVYRSNSNGDAGSWTPRVTATDATVQNRLLLSNAVEPLCQPGGQPYPMGWHCNVIAVDPLDPERVWAAGVDLFRSDDGGRNWGIGSYWWTDPTDAQYVHADQHVILFDPQYDGTSNRRMYVTNDGGVYRTDDARAATATGKGAGCDVTKTSMTWTSLVHDYGATQFYHGAVFPDGRAFAGGAQDNGTPLGTIVGGTGTWEELWGGDGGFVAVDPDGNTVYVESQNAAIVKVQRDTGKQTSIYKGLADSFLFVTPFVLDPNDHNRLYVGGGTVAWRSDNAGASWTRASTTISGTSHVSAIAAAPGKKGRVIAGMTNGVIAWNDSADAANTGTVWQQTKPRDGWVSWLAYDPTNVDVVYATYAGFGGTHVWKSTDGGQNWTALDGVGSGTLPDLPVHSIAVDPQRPSRLYLATDLGVFASTDGGTTWLVEESGFGRVVTETVVVAPGERGPAIYAFTHGRGAWRAELTPTPVKRRSAGH